MLVLNKQNKNKLNKVYKNSTNVRTSWWEKTKHFFKHFESFMQYIYIFFLLVSRNMLFTRSSRFCLKTELSIFSLCDMHYHTIDRPALLMYAKHRFLFKFAIENGLLIIVYSFIYIHNNESITVIYLFCFWTKSGAKGGQEVKDPKNQTLVIIIIYKTSKSFLTGGGNRKRDRNRIFY